MVTEVIMKRELFGYEISQKSKSEFFSATDLHRAGNAWRRKNNLCDFNMSSWLSSNGTKEFIKSLEKEFGQAIIKGRGKGHHTWVHPYLFIDLALAINPNLKIQVYKWLYDKLIEYRNYSGDSYKKMVGAIFDRYGNKALFPKYIQDCANKIKYALNVKDWNSSTEDQLKQRDKIHDYTAILINVMSDTDKALDLAIYEVTKKEIGGYNAKITQETEEKIK